MTANDARPLTARSVLASTLLGTEPPRLPVSFLVRTGELFGFAEGTVRTALSRMVAAGEVVAEGDGRYSLGEQLVRRQRRQRASRAAVTADWTGRWAMGVVSGAGRPPAERQELRMAMARARYGELREGVWLRPDNLEELDRPAGRGGVTWFTTRPDQDPAELAAMLWDLDRWSQRARELCAELERSRRRLERGELDALAPGFVLSAAVLRHFLADPLLPAELLGDAWSGPELRREYDDYDEVFRRSLAGWARGVADRTDGSPAVAAGTVDHRD